MKTPFYLLIFLINFGPYTIAQSHPYEVKFSYQIEQALAEEKISPSRAGLLYSLIGDYSNSIRYSDIPVSWGVDTLNLKHYSTTNALVKIIEKAKNHQIVIISENHLKPQHRIFATQLIKELANEGFEHLGLETFSSTENSNSLLDSHLNKRAYPLDSPLTGTYTLEPQMGKLVRTASQSGFQFFAYERSQKIEGKDRDEIQADNIIRYIENHPDANIIILCGFHHAIESDLIKRGKHYWMAKYLKEKSGIDPLTIYQDNFTEKQIVNEHPSLNSFKPIEPSVFINQSGQIVKISNHVDIEVIHPKTTYINGRPHWLYDGPINKPVKINKAEIELAYPMIVSAYPIGEVDSVPVDRIELKHKYDNKVLVLAAGEYNIRLNDGENIYEYDLTVE